jgi:hypothetical protein
VRRISLKSPPPQFFTDDKSAGDFGVVGDRNPGALAREAR